MCRYVSVYLKDIIVGGVIMIWLALLFGIALLVSAIGFYKYVYFISLGYGFSIAVMGAAMLVLFRDRLYVGVAVSCILFIMYGLRLGGYLLFRELKSASYRSTMKKEIKAGDEVGIGAKLAIWISCALLYVMQVSPVFFRLEAETDGDGFLAAGVVVMCLGVLLESAADIQKSRAKKKNPNRFCDSGLFRIVRCPNYLGEVLFWTGVFVSGISVYGVSPLRWIMSALGYLCIVYVMFGGARRLELRQNRNYGSDPEYQAYVKKTPILIPFVPLYSVADQKWLLG